MNGRIRFGAVAAIFTVIVFMLAATGCTDEGTARRVLSQNGYKNIEITGYDVWTCGKDDTFSTGFKATSPSGQSVEGAVCNAVLKGATIRFK